MKARVSRIIEAIANGSKQLSAPFSPATVAALVGAAALVLGLHMIYPPLALVVPGALCLLFGLWLAGIDFRPRTGGDE